MLQQPYLKTSRVFQYRELFCLTVDRVVMTRANESERAVRPPEERTVSADTTVLPQWMFSLIHLNYMFTGSHNPDVSLNC